MYYLDKNVADLFRIFDQNLRQDYIRMDLNENPGGLDLGGDEAFICCHDQSKGKTYHGRQDKGCPKEA